LKKSLSSHITTTLEASDVQITKPKDLSFGHYCTPIAFSLAKKLRKSPHIIAADLAEQLTHETMFADVNAVSGFVNFKFSDAFLDTFTTQALKSAENYAKSENGKKILIEYVSANPTGPLHIGHARGAVYGDTLVRVGRHLGYDITAEYYVNDAGNQIDNLGLSVLYAGKNLFLEGDYEIPEGCYKGEYINDVATNAKEVFGITIFEPENPSPELMVWAKDEMLTLIKSNLNDAGIIFDTFVSEKEVFTVWDEVRRDLESKSALYTEEEKVFLKSSEHGDTHDRVVVRDNGIPTYLAGDIVYHDQKFKRGYDHYINIWGADHHGYITRVKSAVNHLGHDSEKLEIILSQMVALLRDGEPYKMSKRAGNFILMSDVVEDIGIDALRFIFMTKKSDTHLDFDVDSLSKHDSSNPVFYVNYAHARIASLFRKLEKSPEEVFDVKLDALDDDAKELLFDALLLNEELDSAFNSRNLQMVTDYLYKLSARLHKFYANTKVMGHPQQDQLLKVFAMVALSLRTGLSLLGINAVYSMEEQSA
jgi:arginyl-tRNA synthetase